MSASLLTPELRRTLEGLGRRLGILERRVSNATTTATDIADEIIFSYAGALASSTTSPPVRIRNGGILTVVAVTFGTAGSTGTTLLVQRNGSTVGTISVPSSTTIYNAEVAVRFVADVDTLTVTVDTAGTGATDMTATARFT